VVAGAAVVSVLVVELVLEVDCWLVVSVEDVLAAGAWLVVSVEDVLEAGALDDAAPVCALSFAAVPVVEVAGAVVLAGAAVSGVVGVVFDCCVLLLVVPTFVDEVWSVTGGWPAALDGFEGAVCAFGSAGVVDGVVACAFGSAGVVVDVLLVLFWFWSGVAVVWANATSVASIRIPRTTRNFFMRNSCAKDPGSLPGAFRCLFWAV
jgi:hypothetical protein